MQPRPSPREIRWAVRAIQPWAALLDPAWFNLNRIPADRPLMFVGNHTLYGLLDIPHLILKLVDEHDLLLRSMGDRFHFRVPGWAEALSRWGVVEGNRQACSDLLAQGESVLVFPGGAREVAKRRGEKYTLVWKERLGFVRLAIEHGVTIVPFAMLGGDDAWDIVWDAQDLQNSPFGELMKLAYDSAQVPRGSMMPLAAGLGGLTLLPKPVRLYFSIGQPISAVPWAGQRDNDDACYALRERVADAIYAELDFLAQERKWDPKGHTSMRRRFVDRMLQWGTKERG